MSERNNWVSFESIQSFSSGLLWGIMTDFLGTDMMEVCSGTSPAPSISPVFQGLNGSMESENTECTTFVPSESDSSEALSTSVKNYMRSRPYNTTATVFASSTIAAPDPAQIFFT